MARSIFRDFVDELSKDWKARYPWIAQVSVAHSPSMPKASTFYVGTGNRFRKHLFLNIQHNPKAWAVGDFTVNVIFSSQLGPPREEIGLNLEPDPEGSYRLGILVHSRDKWWSLLPNDNEYGITWRPATYKVRERVLASAVVDVSTDVGLLFEIIGQAG